VRAPAHITVHIFGCLRDISTFLKRRRKHARSGLLRYMRNAANFLHFCLLLFVAFNSFGQRNVVDVPSGETLESKNLFFQEQAVFNKKGINTSTILTYGIGKQIEVGLTVYQLVFQKSKGVEISPEHPEDNPDFLINAQKGFDISNSLRLAIGTKIGAHAINKNDFQFANFSYCVGQISIGESEHKLIGGGYYANAGYAGPGTNLGAMIGLDFTVVKEKLHCVGDFMSGNNSLSVFNAGFEISLPKKWKVTLGAQFPVPGSDNEDGAILQVSKN
jgi:hypothetical protein